MIRVVNYGSGKYEQLANTQFVNGLPLRTYTNPSPKGRGDNYWRWKPEILLNTMTKYKGDFILYIDAGDYHTEDFWKWLTAYVVVSDNLFVSRGYLHREWTKADCLEAMGMLPCIERIDHQLEAGLIGLRANDENIALVEEWAKWMQDDHLVNDAPSQIPNHPDFKEHRHDQSILTNLVLRDKYPIQRVNHVIWNARS
jgi:hypothetical protein